MSQKYGLGMETPGTVYTRQAVLTGRILSRASTCANGLPHKGRRRDASSERTVRMWSAEGAHKGCTHCLKTTEKWEIE